MGDGSPAPQRRSEAFWGRRKGKTLRPVQDARLREALASIGLRLDRSPPDDLRSLFEAPVEEVRLEIGFGGGEHLLLESGRHPTTGFIGIEPFVNGMAKLTNALPDNLRSNLRLYDDDAVQLLDWLPEASIAGIDLFYPDPWPKKRHFKRRFVNAANLDRFARVLQARAPFRFASDIENYVDWTLDHCDRHPSFVEDCGKPREQPYPQWPSTRYEAKAVREGRQPNYLVFRRT